MRNILLLILSFLILSIPASVNGKRKYSKRTRHPKVWAGKVVKVYDGDTLHAMLGDTRVVIRLYGIDTPEIGETGADEARDCLSNMCFGMDIVVVDLGLGKYGRTIGMINVNSTNINEYMIRTRHARVYSKTLSVSVNDYYSKI